MDYSTGKNRPLDPDEYEFVETLRRQESEQYQKMRDEEESELKAFQQAVKASWDQSDKKATVKGSSAPTLKKGGEVATGTTTMNPLRRIKLVRKSTDDVQPVTKKVKVNDCGSDISNEEGLGGLLGNYESDASDS